MIEQTIRQKLPEGFQRSEFLLEHGMLDAIVDRRDLKAMISKALRFMQANPPTQADSQTTETDTAISTLSANPLEAVTGPNNG